jgi:hypothetical protein
MTYNIDDYYTPLNMIKEKKKKKFVIKWIDFVPVMVEED